MLCSLRPGCEQSCLGVVLDERDLAALEASGECAIDVVGGWVRAGFPIGSESEEESEEEGMEEEEEELEKEEEEEEEQQHSSSSSRRRTSTWRCGASRCGGRRWTTTMRRAQRR